MISLNGIPINPTLFPDNTSQIWKVSYLDYEKQSEVVWKFQHESEFLHLAQLKDLLDSKNIKTNLTLTYLPYARQDKNVSNNSTFALHTFAKLLNSLKFNEINILDPHSNIALSLINNSRAIYPIEQIHKVLGETDNHLICYPDAGAVEKYSKIYSFAYISGEKVRDQSTGNITSYKLNGSCEDSNVLIIDDLIDGGATFVFLAKELYNAGAKEVSLFASHGVFSKGLKPLKNAKINRIFTADGEVSECETGFMYRRLS